ncbi:MAG TPA: hypothetical protein VG265_13435 [Gaiellaceae bacterium]|jgi:hypothetical protein|nr:hypothetical protein [Gaiellaceae bacterium]
MNQNELDSAAESIRDAARHVGSRFRRPDDDWAPMLFAIAADGSVGEVVALPPALMPQRTAAAAAISAILRNRHAAAAGLVVSIWSVKDRAWVDANPGRSFSECPSREEYLNCLVTDGTTDTLWSARIERVSARPPRLAEWEQADEVGGRLLGTLKTALLANAAALN